MLATFSFGKGENIHGWKLQDTLGKFNGEPLSNITGAVELPFKNMILTSTEYGALLIWVDGCAQFKIMRRSASVTRKTVTLVQLKLSVASIQL